MYVNQVDTFGLIEFLISFVENMCSICKVSELTEQFKKKNISGNITIIINIENHTTLQKFMYNICHFYFGLIV